MIPSLELVREQLAYRRLSITVVWLSTLVFFATLALLAPAEDILELSGFVSFAIGSGLGFHGWMVDTRERRVRLHCVLPVGRVAIVGSRLLTATVVQIAIAIVPMSAVLVRGDVAATPWQRVAPVLAANLWALVVVLWTYCFEELNVTIHRWRIVVWIVNLLPVAIALWFVSWSTGTDFEFFELQGSLSVAALFCLALSITTVALFVHRRTFEVGVSPLHGFPVKWNEE